METLKLRFVPIAGLWKPIYLSHLDKIHRYKQKRWIHQDFYPCHRKHKSELGKTKKPPVEETGGFFLTDLL